MKLFRISIWGLCLVFGAVLMYSWWPEDEKSSGWIADIGGEFSMVSARGGIVTEKSFPDKAKLMFLGFTNCPDVCPTTLSEISGWLKDLGSDAGDLQPIFITADPERDTSEILDEYVGYFDQRIVALRPSIEELDRFVKDFKIFYEKVPGKNGEYSVDHTASVLLFRDDNSFFGTIDFHEERGVAIAKLRRLIAK